MVRNRFLRAKYFLKRADMAIHILLVSDNPAISETLRRAGLDSPGMSAAGITAAISSYQEAAETAISTSPQILLAEIGINDDAEKWQTAAALKKRRKLPLIAIVPAELLDSINSYPGFDDFIVFPFNKAELLLRVDRLVSSAAKAEKAAIAAADAAAALNPELIRADGLTIDTATCEVTVDGERVDLTFKEYELLKLMAGSRGRVFTREVLLDKIWGYDYFGGDRTVDVHVRRLRSKIEDANHSYIETVRNIGYKFIKNG
jgi:two-component system alkaline phosphatase synthesis response regulator PhoP